MTREPDIGAEARRLVEAGTVSGITVRLIGGLAVAAHAAQPLDAALLRESKDIDVVVEDAAAGRGLVSLMTDDGYTADTRFNAMSGGQRLLLHDDEHGRQVDVFAGTFEMCHVIPVADRLDRHAVTVPLAELLLTKLQIVELNRKDLVDAGALLVSQPVVTSGADGIEGDVISELCARDWGLWRTCTMNLRRVDEHLPELGVAPETAATISARVAELQRQIDEAPKTRGWRIRSRVGDRVRWYHEPDEVDEG